MKIYLIGMPGSGKSTLGKQLAAELMMYYVDLDHEIEKHEGRSIPEIFREKGEDHFRLVEAKLLREWAGSDKNFVMATGGGAPCFHDGMSALNQTGLTIYLEVPIGELVRRLEQRSDRPLLKDASREELEARLNTMLANREAVYRTAHIVIHNPTGETLLERIHLRK